MKNKFSCLFFALVILFVFHTSLAYGSWYAGTWDSTIYNRAERPKTVGIRIEIKDATTGQALSGIRVSLKGTYHEEVLRAARGEIAPRDPQEREFVLEARTGRDGVAVFALQWRKDHPWSFGDPPRKSTAGGGWREDRDETWIKEVDDMEKVEYIELQHRDYRLKEVSFDFNHLTEFGQREKSEMQEPRFFDKFREAWIREIGRRSVKFCVLDLGTGFDDFQNKESTRPDFFEKIREKNYGTVYQRPYNWYSRGEHPQSECGPYFIYELEFRMERAVDQLDVRIRDESREQDTDRRRRQEAARREREEAERREHQEEERLRREREERERREAEKREREEAEERKAREREEEERRKREEEERREREAEERREREREEARRQQLREMAGRDPIGVAVETLTSEKRDDLDLFLGVNGVLILYITPDSPADHAGLRKGQVIYAIDSRTITDAGEYNEKLEGKSDGAQFSVNIWRRQRGEWERDRKRVRLPD